MEAVCNKQTLTAPTEESQHEPINVAAEQGGESDSQHDVPPLMFSTLMRVFCADFSDES